MSTVSIFEFLSALFHGQLLHFQTLNFYSYRGILIAHQTFLVQLGTPGNYFMSRCKEFKQKQLAGTSAALRPLFVNDLTASLMENLGTIAMQM